MSQAARRSVLLSLAAEAVLPALPGCAEVLRGGATTAGLVERGLTLFGQHIADRWHTWSRGQSRDSRRTALNELTALSQEEARREAADALTRLAPDARPQDRVAAAAYLAAIPRTADRVWHDDDPTRVWTPGTVSWEQADDLLLALPEDAPPYNAPCDLPGTPYRLEQLLGAGGFGAVYRAAAASLQHLPLAVKFCLDPALTPALQQERSNLERLMQAGRDKAAQRIVRLYGYDFAHATPYLVYEYVPGGDLDRHVRGRRRLQGRPLTPAEVLGIIRQVVEGLAFAHRHSLVHRDLKPANILVDGQLFKLADFGLGGAATVRAARGAEVGVGGKEIDGPPGRLSRFRAAGTPLYMSPEQRQGAPPDPRHDLYSLGVMWHQMLADDLTRELVPGWAKELAVRYEAPRGHLKLIERCVGRFEDRPKDAGELCGFLSSLTEEKPVSPPPLPPEPSWEVVPIARAATRPAPSPPPLPPPGQGPLLDRLVGQVRRVRRELEVTPRPATPPPTEAQPPGRPECADLLRRLSRAHTGVARRSVWPGNTLVVLLGLMIGALVGWLAGEFYYTVKNPQYGFLNTLGRALFDGGAVLFGAVVGGGAWALAVVALHQIWHWRLWLAREAVRTSVRRLKERFPQEVRDWGGEVVLHEAAEVERLLRRAAGAAR